MTLGSRIREALRTAGMSVKDLERALAGREVAGGSYANLQRYLSDQKTRPSANLLQAIAEETGVRPAWLMSESGPMTAEVGEHQEVELAAARRVQGRLDDVSAWVSEAMGLPTTPTGGSHTPSWISAVVHVWSSCYFTAMREAGEHDLPSPLEDAVARHVGSALDAPLRSLGVSPTDLSEAELRNFVFAMVAALAPIAHHYSGPKEESDA